MTHNHIRALILMSPLLLIVIASTMKPLFLWIRSLEKEDVLMTIVGIMLGAATLAVLYSFGWGLHLLITG